MKTLDEFTKEACGHALERMFRAPVFSVVDFDNIARALGRGHALNGHVYETLRAINGMEWAAMGDELAQQVQAKCLELLQVRRTGEPIRHSKLSLWRRVLGAWGRR